MATASSSLPKPPPAGPPAWSVAVCLRHRGGLEIRASAENVLPGWGRGGERLSLLLRLRRRLLLAVTAQCGPRAPAPSQPGTSTRGCKLLRFLRSRWARVPPIWRRRKPHTRAAAAAPGPRSQRWLQRNRASTARTIQQRYRAGTPTAATTLGLAAVAVASIAAFYLVSGGYIWGGRREAIAPCASWGCMVAQFLEPPSLGKYGWLLRLPRLGLQWLLSK